MVHGVRLRDGRAEWYRNRWVRTRAFTDDAPFLTDTGLDLTAVSANTHVIRHAGRILTLVENGFPYEMTPELDTVGPVDFGGRLTTAMTAHPKELDGELHFFGYGVFPPYLTYHRLSRDGELVESREVEVPGPTMIHDFAVTEHYAIWLDLPVVFDLNLAGSGIPFRWDDDYGARLGVMRRADGHVTWFDVDSCYVFHVANARENAAGQVVLDAVRYTREGFGRFWQITQGGSPADLTNLISGVVAEASLHRWVLDPTTGTSKEEQLDDRGIEFPSINDARVGRPNRYIYTVGRRTIVKYDTDGGGHSSRDMAGQPGEAVFVPAGGARSEDDGYLMAIVSDTEGARLDVVDASALEPVASVRLPRRVPFGFHGSWIADA
jgi:carotenoid cleavage dioxygenase